MHKWLSLHSTLIKYKGSVAPTDKVKYKKCLHSTLIKYKVLKIVVVLF